MSIDLLAPRFKVVADYPNSNFDVGEIIEFKPLRKGNGRWIAFGKYSVTHPNELNKFPHLFKKLEWYEDRDFKDWPKYVKWEEDIIFEVLNWRTNPNTSQLDGVYTDYGFLFIKDIIPATKEEFEIYQSKINKPVK